MENLILDLSKSSILEEWCS